MFCKNTAALLAAALMPLTNAYRLTFYAGFDCNGERLESRQAIQDGTCYDPEYLGASTNSITIVQEEGDDPNSIVVFFPRGSNCTPRDSISAGNSGCINVYQDGSFGGYHVISGQDKRRAVREDDQPEPDSSEASPGLGITHGDFFESDGELWRWNQIALNTFSGVKPEDWAGEVRIANFAPLEAGRDYPFNYTEYDLIHHPERLTERAVTESNFSPNYDVEALGLVKRQDVCRRIRDCIWTYQILAGYYFPRTTEIFLNNIEAAKPSVQSFWSFLQKPYISGPIVTLSGGYIGSRYFPSCPSCTPDCATNEREGVRTTLNEGTTPGLPASAISSDIIDGSETIGTLTAIITPPTQQMNGICNTPVPNGARGQFALSRHMLPLYADVPGFAEWVKTKDFSV